ncbi:hypothetical protein Tco_0896810 [Tanacetum coccineum]
MNDFLTEDRVTWLAISGLTPKMWTPDTFTAIANHWGDVIVLEDCNPRQVNRITEDVNSVTNEAPAIGNFENRNKDGNTLCGNIGKYKPSDNNKSNEG